MSEKQNDDARLISDLLNSLKEMVSCFERIADFPEEKAAIATAHAIIARAEGRS